jgi:hypothetical protein
VLVLSEAPSGGEGGDVVIVSHEPAAGGSGGFFSKLASAVRQAPPTPRQLLRMTSRATAVVVDQAVGAYNDATTVWANTAGTRSCFHDATKNGSACR